MKLEKAIYELQKQIEENNKTIAKLTTEKDVLISCQSGINNTLSVFFSLISYFTLFGTIAALYGNGSISIPTELSTCIIAGGSLISATVTKKILTKKARNDLKKDYTETENIEKTISLLAKIETLKAINNELKTAIDKLKEAKKTEEGTAIWAKELGVKIKETVSKDYEKDARKIEDLIENIKIELNEKNQELAETITEKQLEKYAKNKFTFTKKILISALIACCAMAPLLLKFTPGFNEVRTPLQTLITLLTPLAISTAVCTSSMTKQNTYLKTALSNLEIKQKIYKNAKEASKKECTVSKEVYEYKFDENYYKTYYKTDLQPCEIEEQLQQNPKQKVLVYTIKNQKKGH